MFRKHLLFPALISAGLGLGLLSCGSNTETVQEPTQGLVTTLTEVSDGDFRIASEETVPNVTDSKIILNKLDGTSETITLGEARMMTTADSTRYSSEQRRAVRRSSGGFFWFMMYNRMGGHTPRASAYASQSAYNRSSTAGNSVRSTAKSTTRTRSGFGKSSSGRSSGGSTRSFGG
ncbi:MAG: hypothetical protein AAF597_03020 [Bacteroidota bacterium]